MSKPLTAEEEEREARGWLEAALRMAQREPEAKTADIPIKDIRVILRLLDRPRLPAEPTAALVQAMRAAVRQWTHGEDIAVAVHAYHALYAHLTRPRTKTVWSASYVLRDAKAKGTPTPYEITDGSLDELLTHLGKIDREWPGRIQHITITHREVPL